MWSKPLHSISAIDYRLRQEKSAEGGTKKKGSDNLIRQFRRKPNHGDIGTHQ
jgi:hypothetical protein